MKKLYLVWQDPEKRRWTPVGILSSENGTYRFVYTEGAKNLDNFQPFRSMDDIYSQYESNELFPVFANRLLPKSRPEYKSYLNWLNLSEADDSPFAILSLTGGTRATDSLEIFECPLPNEEGKFEVHFFSHGVRHLPKNTIERIQGLNPGEKLFMMADIQNSYDSYAIAMRTDDPVSLVGYCPRYLTADFKKLLDVNGPENIHLSVEKVNPDSPAQFRLLCKVLSDWPQSFEPCTSDVFKPLV